MQTWQDFQQQILWESPSPLRLSDRGLARLGKLGLVLFKTAAQLAFTARRVGAELCFGRAGVAQLTFA
jgi:hypothetical protein